VGNPANFDCTTRILIAGIEDENCTQELPRWLLVSQKLIILFKVHSIDREISSKFVHSVLMRYHDADTDASRNLVGIMRSEVSKTWTTANHKAARLEAILLIS